MASPALNWRSAGLTDVGLARSVNEDAFLERTESGLWVVADGMGGHDAGDYASRLIVEALSDVRRHADFHRFYDDVERRLVEVNRRLFERAQRRERTIGSTVAAVLAFNNNFLSLWAGDSRVYHVNERGIQQITRDHSQVQELVALGELRREDMNSHPMANVITRAVGGAAQLRLEGKLQTVCEGDRLLICSDGLYKDLTDEEICGLVMSGDPANACNELVDRAMLRGGNDNITVIVVEYTEQPSSENDNQVEK